MRYHEKLTLSIATMNVISRAIKYRETNHIIINKYQVEKTWKFVIGDDEKIIDKKLLKNLRDYDRMD